MYKYVLRRIIQAIPIFFGITILSYGLMSATPGGPVAALAFGANLKASEVEALKIQLGVNDPWFVQYIRWLTGDDWLRWDTDGDRLADQSFLIGHLAPSGEPLPPGERRGILRGDFGVSFVRSRAVLPIILERLPASIELGVASLVVGASIGILVGVVAAVQHDRWFDHITRVLAVVFDAVPIFFLAILLLLLFGVVFFGTPLALPLGDRCRTTLDPSCPPIFQRLEYLILPTFVLATGSISAYSRFMRASMLEVVSQDYMRTARAKGLSDRALWLRHGARNALIPIATFLGPAIAGIWGGAVITETIFNWPGVGRTIVAAVTARDYPIVMAATVFAGISTILGYLLSDILYGIIDPRIRFD